MESIAKYKYKAKKTKGRANKTVKKGIVFGFIKSSLVGVAVSIVLVLLYAVLLYSGVLKSESMSIVNSLIKIISSLAASFVAISSRSRRLYLVGAIAGGLYMSCAFLLFSLLSQTLNLSLSFLSDLGVGVFTGMLFAMIINAFKK